LTGIGQPAVPGRINPPCPTENDRLAAQLVGEGPGQIGSGNDYDIGLALGLLQHLLRID
jgi:hypothetical protein